MSELAIVGEYRRAWMQRMTHDNGVDTHLQDQSLAGVPVLFAEQWEHAQRHGSGPYPPWEKGLPGGPPSGSFLLLEGRFVEGEFRAVRYADNDGAKPVDTTYETRRWRFFLAERAVDLRDCHEEVSASGLPLGQPVALDRVPEALRARPAGVFAQQQMQQQQEPQGER